MLRMTLLERKAALAKLGEYLLSDDEYLAAVVKRSSIHNPWFTEAFQQQAIKAIATQMLDEEKLEEWLATYSIPESVDNSQKVGLVMAGNLPLVGFHDLLSVFASGHQAVVKLSEKDPYLLPALLKALRTIDSRTETYFEMVEKLTGFDAVIATGSNNSARYFKAYFDKYPHIIRKNRNGVAILTGEETADELHAFGKDVFDYFGLGCRNVSKLYVPKGYNFDPLLEALHKYNQLVTHTKYKNNFDYNYALYILNKVELKANGCVLMSENTSLQSPIACLHYEFYENIDEVEKIMQNRQEEIQLVVSQHDFNELSVFPLGQAQSPTLSDYADGVDTMNFLLNL